MSWLRRNFLVAAYIAAVLLAFAATAKPATHPSAASLVRGFTCIHRYEGAWTANTGNGYYGGLQMDLTFQRRYGPEYLRAFGTADKWTPGMQIAVAIKAHVSGRGYGPWPNTRRRCGL